MIHMQTLADWLEKHPVFSSLGATDRAELGSHAVRRSLQKGEALALQGDVWPSLFLVAEGELQAVKVSSEGRTLLVTTFGAGELFWGLAFFQDGIPQIVTLQAHLPTCAYLWSRAYIEPFFLAHGKMSWELCHLMIQRMQRANTIVEELAFQPIAGRLARLLLDNFAGAQDKPITRDLTLDEMAARVGTTREMVCRALYRFSDKDLIEVTRTEFVLTDREGLRRIASGT
jgi:CRP/FNR family transcriptional regulator, cyclic AMP receptor protein